jgi:hypothetical protein
MNAAPLYYISKSAAADEKTQIPSVTNCQMALLLTARDSLRTPHSLTFLHIHDTCPW